MPWKLFESMACGVPVLVARGSSRAKFVEKHRCGVVLPNDTSDFVAEVIRSLAEDPAQHQQMSTAGKQLAESEFNWEAMSNKLIRIYEALRIPTAEAKAIAT
jgi:glycosyltransferase involved in cell wall biosynthesis